MSLWRIAWRSIQQRGVASLLTALSMALGVMLVVCVLSVHGVIARSFRSNTNLGYNMIVGAKGGSLQLTLNSVFYLSQTIENVPYDFYLEFLDAEHRTAEYDHSIQRQLQDAAWLGQTLQILPAASAGPTGLVTAGQWGVLQRLRKISLREFDFSSLLADRSRSIVPLQAGRPGRYSQFTKLAIPLCLGDCYGRFRVIGTTPEFFTKLTFGESGERTYQFAAGRNFKVHGARYGSFEAVVGRTVADEMQLKLGDRISTTHGDPEQGGKGHAQGFYVVGILEPSGTPNDRAVFVNIEGFYLMEGHAKPIETKDEVFDTSSRAATPHHHSGRGLPVEQREVTAILVRTVSPEFVPGLQNLINEGQVAQAVLPVAEIYRLFDTFVKPIQRVLLVLTVMICVVSGISILVSIYNSMSDRRHEIAVMRALGASRNTVMSVILLESIFLSLAGGALGWTLGHGVNAIASPEIERHTGVAVGFWDLAPSVKLSELLGTAPSIAWLENLRVSSELLLVPALILLAVIVGFFPALTAYRTDVAQSLGK